MTHRPGTEPDQPMVYEVRIKGRLASRWNDWFAPMTIKPEAGGDTILSGPVVDQAALHGLLTKIRDLGLPLISVSRVDPGQDESIDALNANHRKDQP